MIKFKYSVIVLSIILILFIFISSASAADVNKTDVLSIDESINLENNLLSVDNNVKSNELSNDTLKVSNDEILTAGNNWYVNASKPSGGDGKSEADAFKTLNEALTNNELQDYDTIMIASGEYTGFSDNVGLTISKNLNFIKYGDGEAIFDAQGLSRIWNVRATSINITGLTFKNGKISDRGAAIYFDSLSNSNINASFVNNSGSEGGAIFVYAGTSGCNITGSFVNNSGTDGGAIQFWGQVRDCNINASFVNNHASNDGGAIHFYPSIFGCNITGYFADNVANRDGGAIHFDDTISDCNINGLFENNVANRDAGAFQFAYTVTNSNVFGCFVNNTAINEGGAIYVYNSIYNSNITACFVNNTANEGNSIALRCFSGCDLNIINCIFSDKNSKSIFIEDAYSDNHFINLVNNRELIDNVGEYFILNNEGWNLNLSNNSFVSPIYNKGKILSKTNVTILDNSTKIYYNNSVNLDAYILDDNHNFIVMDDFTFKVNTTEVKALFNNQNHANIDYDLTAPGKYLVTNESDTLLDNTVYYSIIILSKCIPTNITVNTTSLNITVGDTDTIIANLTPFGAGNLSFTSIDPSIATVDSNGVVTAVGEGNTIITVSFAGDETYAPADNQTVIVNVTMGPISVTADNVTKYYSGSEQFIVNVTNSKGKGISGKSVLITINNVTYNRTTDENGTARLNLNLPSGNYTVITVVDNITINSTVTIKSTITGVDIKSELRNVTYSAMLIDSEGNPLENGTAVEFNIDGIIYTAEVIGNDGMVNADLILNSGNYTITAINPRTGEKHSNNITINAKNPSINVTAEEITFGENATVSVNLPQDATGNVTVGNESVPVVNGTAIVILTNLPVGNNTFTVTYSGDAKYNNASTPVTISVLPESDVNVYAPNVTKYYHGPEEFVVYVCDSELNPIANKSVNITINSITYTRITDAFGTASIALKLGSGLYDVVTKMDNITVNSTVTILSTVNSSDVVKMYKNNTQYYATFLDSQGKYLADGTPVRFNINGVLYEHKIYGDMGLAELDINLPAGEYIITAMNLITGENAANNITVLSNLVENRDIIKYFKNSTQYTVKVICPDGNVAGSGEKVTFNINGVFYYHTTDENGIVKLDINLPPGDYIITAEYSNGCKVSNDISVLPVLTAKDISMKYGDGTKFVANLVDGQGNPYAQQNIQFNLIGIFYNEVTDSNGQAAFPIDLMPGEYIVTSSYNDARISNKITILS